MAALSYANAWALIKTVVKILDETEKYARSNTPNFDTLHDSIIAANLGDYQSAVIGGAEALRARLGACLEPDIVRAAISGPLAEMAAAINAPERGPPETILFRLKEYMIALGTDDTVNAREWTRGAASAGGSNVGNGTINRLNVDEDGYPLEASHAEAKTWECIQDQNQVDIHEEVFEVRGAKAEPDRLVVIGSGIRQQIAAISHKATQAVLVNTSFSQFSGTQPTAGVESTPAATTSVTGWVLTTAANARVSVDTVYRDLVGETRKYSLRFTGNNKIVQTLSEQRRARLSTGRPYYVQIAVYRESSADGTLTVRWGANTQTYDVSTFTNSAWKIVRLDLDKDLYYKNFKESGFTFEVELGSRTTGTIYIDDVIIAPMTLIDGTYFALVGGATPFLLRDTFTVTDSESATRGKIQYWLGFRSGYGFSLPAVLAAAETITDPA
jgi:hypothetical protein